MKAIRKLVTTVLALCVAAGLFSAMPINSKAAQGTVVLSTTMECSVWSAPATVEANRVKKIPAGYQVTVIPSVVASTIGDGKTFYQTAKGCYILCKCFGETEQIQPAPSTDPYSPENISATLLAYKNVYPEGMRWTGNENVYYWDSSILGYGLYGYDCVAFAMILSDGVFGHNPVIEYKEPGLIRTGDILRISNDSHSVIVTGVNADGSVRIAEGNYNKSVHWDRVLSKEYLDKNFSYGWTRY